MKKVLSLFMSFLLLIAFTGCNGESSNGNSIGNPDNPISSNEGGDASGNANGTVGSSGSTITTPDYLVENKVEKLAIKRGINVSLLYRYKMTALLWYRYSYITKPETYSDIKAQGFDHVRLPVDFDLYYKDGKIDEAFLKKLDGILNTVLGSGLVVILDFHGLSELNNNAEANKAEFYAIWEQLAERYKNYPDTLFFELYNEPKVGEGADPLTANRLNEIQNEVIKRIRVTNPLRILVAAAPEWNSWWGLKDLRLPETDPNIIVDIHTYQPMEFTHQGETWYDENATEQVRISQSVYAEIDKVINTCREYKNSTGRTLWLGEFGMNTTVADKNDITNYLGYVAKQSESIGMPWAVWEYGWNPGGDSGFDIYSIKNKAWKTDILKAIIK